MNTATYSGLLARLLYRLMLSARYLGVKPTCECLGTGEPLDAIQRIYVINLDRQVPRFRQMQEELNRVQDRSGRPLTAITRRFSAVDARYFTGPLDNKELQPHYSLADQLFVDPHPLLETFGGYKDQRILMTRQEVAVALSHIPVCKTIPPSHPPYTLLLDDAAY